jgi:DinB family protein
MPVRNVPSSAQRVLRRLDQAWAAFRQSYAGLSDAELSEPRAVGEWSVKDIVAHVTTWEAEALQYLPLIAEGGRPPRYSRYGGIDAFNAQTTERKRGLSIQDVLRDLDDTHEARGSRAACADRVARGLDAVPPAPAARYLRPLSSTRPGHTAVAGAATALR